MYILDCCHVDCNITKKGFWILIKTEAEIGHHLAASLLVDCNAYDGIIHKVDVCVLGAEELWEVSAPIYTRFFCI